MPKTILFAANKGLQATLGVTLRCINAVKVPKSPDSTLVTQSIMHNYSQALPFLREGGNKQMNSQLYLYISIVGLILIGGAGSNVGS